MPFNSGSEQEFEFVGADRNVIFSGIAAKMHSILEGSWARDGLKTLLKTHGEKEFSSKDMAMLATPELFNSLLFDSIDTAAVTPENTILKHPLGIPGAATGTIAMNIAEAQKLIEKNIPYILALPETSAEDIEYIKSSAGVITFEGGITSHASIITRQLGKPAIIGTGDLSGKIKNGDAVTIDGSNGLIIRGKVPIKEAEIDNPDLSQLLDITDAIKPGKAPRMGVKANADNPKDAAEARALGAKGIGVARTEHMFFGMKSLVHAQLMMMAENKGERDHELETLFGIQKEDFKGIMKAMEGLPVTIRLLDAPLHEFLPKGEAIAAFAKKTGKSAEEVAKRSNALHENNPMLGNRAIRLAVLHPEIYEMQVKAILMAAAELKQEGVDAQPQIMIPLVHDANEFAFSKKLIDKVVRQLKEDGVKVPAFKTGVMMETPAACLAAGTIAKEADFFSFGTNDLTQTALGMSREDTGAVIAKYQQLGIYKNDPFQTIHPAVAQLMQISIAEGKKANPKLQVSICGEHGGDPQSIHTCQEVGVDAVSVANSSIPIARLVTAQAMIRNDQWVDRATASKSSQATRTAG
jgi:pyruvate,orthophosphate dikinase